MYIDKNEIHLWIAYDQEISDPGLIADYLCLLTDEEREQQQRFHFEKHRHQYLVTRALVRSTLSRYVESIQPAEWVFNKNSYGKPAIANLIDRPLRFNLSHTDGMIVLAVTLERDVGVDVEWMQRNGQTIEIAEHFFSSREVEQLYALPLESQRDRFFRLWTLKEAYIKAFGMGLSIPLDQFGFSFSAQNECAIGFDAQWDDCPENWLFWQIQPGPFHKMAVALKVLGKTDDSCALVFRKVVPMLQVNEIHLPCFSSISG